MTPLTPITSRPRAVLQAPRGLVPALVVFATVIFAVVVLFKVYAFRPTAAYAFLVLGWISLLAFAWAAVRAAKKVDFEAAAASLGDLDEDRREDLVGEKKLLLKAIKEIEFDREMGKISEVDAATATSRYRARAIEILRVLEEDKPKDYGALVEAELAKRLAKAKVEPVAAEKANTSSASARQDRRKQDVVEEGRCSCGTVNDADAAFCKRCGARLKEVAS